MARQNALVTITTNPQGAAPLILSLRQPVPLRRGVALPSGFSTGVEPVRLSASGGTGGNVFALAHGEHVPAGCSFDTVTGYITGTPTTIGRTTFLASVEDSSTTVAQGRFTLDVLTSLIPVNVTPVPGEIGLAYDYTLRVIGATGPVSWTVMDGALPPGITISGSDLVGTPTGTGAVHYATLLATDSVSGDVLPVPVVITIADALYETCPSMTCSFTKVIVRDGEPCSVELSPLFAGGVPPYRVAWTPPFYTAFAAMRVTRNKAGKFFFTGVPSLALQGGNELVTVPQFEITDALGVLIATELEIRIIPRTGSIYAQKDGTPVGSGGTNGTFNFIGAKDVSANSASFDVDVTPQATAQSVLGCATSVAGDALPIQATTNNRVLARVSNVLQWVQVTPAMISATGTAAATNFLRGDGSWSQVTVGTIFASGTASASTVLRGDGVWSAFVSSISWPSIFSVSGTTALNVTLANQAAAMFLAGATSGGSSAPTFRAIIVSDLPSTLQRILSTNSAAGDTVANTVTATAFTTNYSIAAADIKAGCVVRVRAQGTYGTAAAAPNLTLQLRFSNTSVLTIGPLAMPASAPSTSSWFFEGDVFIPSIGGSVSCRANGFSMFGQATSLTQNFIAMPQPTALSLATNAIKQVQVFVTWGTANASNTITLQRLDVEVLSP